jgi:hypothetical protein
MPNALQKGVLFLIISEWVRWYFAAEVPGGMQTKMHNELCVDLLQNSNCCIAKATLFIRRCNAKSQVTTH